MSSSFQIIVSLLHNTTFQYILRSKQYRRLTKYEGESTENLKPWSDTRYVNTETAPATVETSTE